jgi:hypothetical protein
MEWWNDGILVFEEIYPYMNNFNFPVKRDVESVIPVFPAPKKNEPALWRARISAYDIQKEDKVWAREGLEACYRDALASPPVETTVGVRKMSSSVLSRVSTFALNSQPKIGIDLK